MPMTIDLSTYLNQENVARVLDNSVPVKMGLMDLLLPPSTRANWLMGDMIGIDAFTGSIKNEVLVESGTAATAMNGESSTTTYYKFPEFRKKTFLSADDVNRMVAAGKGGMQQWADRQILRFRDSAMLTAQSMLASIFQSTYGTMAYPVSHENGVDVDGATINFGSMKTAAYSGAGTTAWNVATCAVDDVLNLMAYANSQISDALNYGQDVYDSINLVGSTAWYNLVRICKDLNTSSELPVDMTRAPGGEIVIAGMRFVHARWKHYTYAATGVGTAGALMIGTNDVFHIPNDTPRGFWFGPTNDLEKGNPVTPLNIIDEYIKDPSGYKIIGTNRPFPYVAPVGVCKIQVY